ncbi:MAG: Y-family DNA polymerase, partial [Mycobacterium leprae]
LDVSDQDALAVGRALKEEIRRELRLTASVGISYCKFLAKMASDMEKPNGFTVVTALRAQELLPTMPVRRLWGVGPASEQALKALGITTCGEILRHDPAILRRHFGRRADELIMLARGIDPRPVEASHEMKSIGQEQTFAQDQSNRVYLGQMLDRYAQELCADLERYGLAARTVTLKIKWNVFVPGGPTGGDFLSITRSHTLDSPTHDTGEIAQVARELLAHVEWEGRKVRLIGLSLHNFVRPGDLIQARLPL